MKIYFRISECSLEWQGSSGDNSKNKNSGGHHFFLSLAQTGHLVVECWHWFPYLTSILGSIPTDSPIQPTHLACTPPPNCPLPWHTMQERDQYQSDPVPGVGGDNPIHWNVYSSSTWTFWLAAQRMPCWSVWLQPWLKDEGSGIWSIMWPHREKLCYSV